MRVKCLPVQGETFCCRRDDGEMNCWKSSELSTKPYVAGGPRPNLRRWWEFLLATVSKVVSASATRGGTRRKTL